MPVNVDGVMKSSLWNSLNYMVSLLGGVLNLDLMNHSSSSQSAFTSIGMHVIYGFIAALLFDRAIRYRLKIWKQDEL